MFLSVVMLSKLLSNSQMMGRFLLCLVQKYFTVDVNGQQRIISIDCLKGAHLETHPSATSELIASDFHLPLMEAHPI